MEAFQLRLWDGRIGRWLSPDPYGEFHSPYLGMGNNPVSTIDPDGGCTICPNNGKAGDTFNHPAYGTLTSDGNGNWNSSQYGTILNDVSVSKGSSTLSTAGDIALGFVPFSSTIDMYKGARDGNWGQFAMGAAFVTFDALTLGTGSLVEGGIKAAIKVGEKQLAKDAFEDLAKSGIKYTKSSMTLGREVHASYRITNVVKGVAEKEFRQIPGIRPDFVDLEAKIIYELKPFNKNGFRSGTKQLAKYKPLLEKQFGGEFKTVLEFY
jgi:hypothetical protein